MKFRIWKDVNVWAIRIPTNTFTWYYLKFEDCIKFMDDIIKVMKDDPRRTQNY